MVQGLQAVAPGAALSLTFLPHLAPMTRGIFTSCYAKLKGGKTADDVVKAYRDFYRGEAFVRVTGAPPQTKHVSGTNLCLVHPAVDTRAGRLIALSCIDNLVKGGAGQAVQCMNLMLGLPEGAGLERAAVYP
jgi:N-acetyl-gamma-glutamyl-phosphate reductase